MITTQALGADPSLGSFFLKTASVIDRRPSSRLTILDWILHVLMLTIRSRGSCIKHQRYGIYIYVHKIKCFTSQTPMQSMTNYIPPDSASLGFVLLIIAVITNYFGPKYCVIFPRAGCSLLFFMIVGKLTILLFIEMYH